MSFKKDGGVFFLYGYGGTGKTIVWKTLSIALCCQGEIVLNVASSGIATLLLDGDRTAHSRFAIPINVNKDSFCHITPDSHLASLIRKKKLIIWDEAPMVNKHCFEALDRTFRDILRCTNSRSNDILFGGKVIFFGGDFRQVLSVIQNGKRSDVVNASLNASCLWHHCKVLRLTVNMRLRVGSETADLDERRAFAEWILNVGNGIISEPNDGEAKVEIPEDILVKDEGNPIGSIVSSIYPNFIEHMSNPTYFQERAILAPTHDVVDIINNHMMDLVPCDENVYLSSDSICESDQGPDFNIDMYNIKVGGLPNHGLCLKKDVPVMLLRNIDQPSGLCNGTRLRMIRLGDRIIEAEIISGSNIGMKTYIPRMLLSPSDKRIPFKFQRRQFPLVPCFAMTINKSQGQSLSRVGLFLQRHVFTHVQMYVALSRVKSKTGLKVLIMDKDGKLANSTTNVVYKEVLQDL